MSPFHLWIPCSLVALAAADPALPVPAFVAGVSPGTDGTLVRAEKSATTNASGNSAHSHDAVEIDGQPIVSRIDAELDRPRRVLLDPEGTLYIADSAANKVFKIAADGTLSTLADELDEPSGLARDEKGNLYVSNHADGKTDEGTVVVVGRDGKQKLLAKGLTGPKGMAFDAGRLYVACFDDNRIVVVAPDGEFSTFAEGVSSPAGLVFDADGNLYAVNSIPGTVTKIAPDGERSIFARGLQIPSDITLGPDGRIVAANYGGRELTEIASDGKTSTYLPVPPGTIGLCFDGSGNLRLVNWDFHLALKVVNRLSIPCPHCGKKIPVRIRPKAKPEESPQKII